MNPIRTQSIKYAGSKLRLLPFILELVDSVRPRSVFDGFAGTTRVGQALASRGVRVISNDLADWSEVLGHCYFINRRPSGYFSEMIAHLNGLKPVDGWFTEHYGGSPDGPAKRPWQIHNTRRLDAVRTEIDRLGLDETDRSVLLTSLMLALDAVDSTIGHHAAYLKAWSARSYKTMRLDVPRFPEPPNDHRVIRGDVFDALGTAPADLAYFDPPYGSNNEKMPPSRVRYAGYYHLWTTVVRNDRPELFGRANRRADSRDTVAGSVFEDFRRDSDGRFFAVDAIDRLIEGVQARYVLLSYSSGGRATADQLESIIGRRGKLLRTAAIEYRRNVMAEMRWTNAWLREADTPNREFLFLIEK